MDRREFHARAGVRGGNLYPVGEFPRSITLVPIAGPPVESIVLSEDGPSMIGRLAECAICLLDTGVSRRHASLRRRDTGWFLVDEGSAGGTFLTGVRLPRAYPAMLAAGDLLRIGPWVFRVSFGAGASAARAIKTVDDSALRERAMVASSGADFLSRADRRLRLLTECIALLSGAADEEAAARSVLESALRGSGYSRGALLRRVKEDATGLEIVVSQGSGREDSEVSFSRTLIERAGDGETVILTGGSTGPGSYSPTMAEMNIHSAMCVPVKLDALVAWYLYLDARGQESSVMPDASGFCEALATAFGLAMANLRRAELSRRQQEIYAEMLAAREVQQTVMPAERGEPGCARYAMRSLPGSFVAGDLFDAVCVQGGRVAFSLGDVAGHGAGSAMLMATAQAFLHAQLLTIDAHEGPVEAITRLNEFICHRTSGGRFLSLWLGVLSPDGTLRYVDAGHGHWLVRTADGMTDAGERTSGIGIPIGIDPDAAYAEGTLILKDADRLLLYSDGIIEETSVAGEFFGVERLRGILRSSPGSEDDIRSIFQALAEFRGSSAMNDDATAASITLNR